MILVEMGIRELLLETVICGQKKKSEVWPEKGVCTHFLIFLRTDSISNTAWVTWCSHMNGRVGMDKGRSE